MSRPGRSSEVVVTLDGRPRPATVMEREPTRVLVRFRDAGAFCEQWVPLDDVIEVERRHDRGSLVKALGLVVILAAGLALLLVPGGSDKRLSEVLPATSAAPTATGAPTATPTPSVITALFFGDSFVAGRGLAKGQPTAVQVAARQLGWRSSFSPGDGTGFTTGGRHGGVPYRVRLNALRTAPEVMVLQGGAADTSAPATVLTTAVGDVLNDLAARFPTTRVVVLGPVAMEQPADGQLVRVDSTLRAAATAHHVSFLDPITLHWITPANAPDYTAATGFYPNAAGHAYLGTRLAAALRGVLRRT